MATPHITGLIAYLLKAEGPRTPDAMSKRLQELALKDVLTGVREYFWQTRLLNYSIPFLAGDTVNFLAQNHHWLDGDGVITNIGLDDHTLHT